MGRGKSIQLHRRITACDGVRVRRETEAGTLPGTSQIAGNRAAKQTHRTRRALPQSQQTQSYPPPPPPLPQPPPQLIQIVPAIVALAEARDAIPPTAALCGTEHF